MLNCFDVINFISIITVEDLCSPPSASRDKRRLRYTKKLCYVKEISSLLQTGNARKGLIRMTRKVHSSPAAVIFLAEIHAESKGGFRTPFARRYVNCTYSKCHRLPPGVFLFFSPYRSPIYPYVRMEKNDASLCRVIHASIDTK